jgi:predicted transcriptional regulator
MEHKILLANNENSPIVIRALNSELRRKMLQLLSSKELNINDIAENLNIPQSTCTTNIKLLEEAKLITVTHKPAKNGAQKLCSAACAEVVIPIFDTKEQIDDSFVETEMPIGLYTNFSAAPPCGLLSDKGVIGYYDDKHAFLNPNRATAQLVWFQSGFLEYKFPMNIPPHKKVKAISVIAEVCSEFPGHNSKWPSDITLWINDHEIGTWTSPGDMGGKRGHLTPSWWSSKDTQFGFRKIWKTTSQGSFIDSMRSSQITLGDLDILSYDSFTIRIGLKADSQNQGGLNIFGRKFGNYENDILLRIDLD